MAEISEADRDALQNLMAYHGVIGLLVTLGELVGPSYQDIFTEAADKARARSKQVDPQGIVNTQS